MPRLLRFALILLGLLLLCCALTALLYVFWPLGSSLLQATVEPTLLSPP